MTYSVVWGGSLGGSLHYRGSCAWRWFINNTRSHVHSSAITRDEANRFQRTTPALVQPASSPAVSPWLLVTGPLLVWEHSIMLVKFMTSRQGQHVQALTYSYIWAFVEGPQDSSPSPSQHPLLGLEGGKECRDTLPSPTRVKEHTDYATQKSIKSLLPSLRFTVHQTKPK